MTRSWCRSAAARRWTPPRRSTSAPSTTSRSGSSSTTARTLEPGRPVIAVPTTAGTGAETNSYGVITDETAGRKGYIGHPSLLPRVTILDPGLTVGLPPAATAATGIDAMTHSLESLLSANPNPFAEAMALGVIRTVGSWLRRAVADGTDLEARSQMLMASHLAGVGQASGTGVGLVHALGHAIGTRGRVAHGTALAAVLPEVLRFYLGRRDRELALVGIALGVATAAEMEATAAAVAIGAIDKLLRDVGPAAEPAVARSGRRRGHRPDRRRCPRRRRDPQLAAAADRRRGARDPGLGRAADRGASGPAATSRSPGRGSPRSTPWRRGPEVIGGRDLDEPAVVAAGREGGLEGPRVSRHHRPRHLGRARSGGRWRRRRDGPPGRTDPRRPRLPDLASLVPPKNAVSSLSSDAAVAMSSRGPARSAHASGRREPAVASHDPGAGVNAVAVSPITATGRVDME